jgi:hypothetical protein
MKRMLPVLAGILLLAGCGDARPRSDTYTLYRNSDLDTTMRVHWSTFDADESADYNRGNCEMAAHLLNENFRRLNGDNFPGVKFWCELGRYRASNSN